MLETGSQGGAFRGVKTLCEKTPNSSSEQGKSLGNACQRASEICSAGSSHQIKFENQTQSPVLKHFFNGTFPHKQSQPLPREHYTDAARVELRNKVFEMLFPLLKCGPHSENENHGGASTGEIRP